MNTDTKIIIGAIVISALLVAGSILLLGKNASPQIKDLGTASMVIDKTSVDLGDMKVDEERTTEFTLTNSSDSTLRIWNVSTSCNCTFASVVIGNQTFGEFNMPMHTNSKLKNWIGEISPKQIAVLKVTYRPKIMPVTGKITRSVTFSTNDPNKKTVQVDIAANVL